jgi:hypothetical protein
MIWYICVCLGEDCLSKYADGERVGLKDIFKHDRYALLAAADIDGFIT